MKAPLRLAALAPAFCAAPTLVLAHPGLHHHPHGIEGVWGLALLALGAGVAAALILRGRK